MKAPLKTTALFFLPILADASLAAPALRELDRAELEARLEGDARDILIHREGLRSVIDFVDSRPDLFPDEAPDKLRMMRRDEKEAIWNMWQSFLDYQLALESTERYHASYLRLRRDAREDSFLIGHTAMLARYRSALEFIERMEKNPDIHKILNEPVPEIGLPGGTYARLKFKFLNVGTGTHFAAREVVLKTFKKERQPDLREAIAADAKVIWQAGKGRGELMTIRNAVKIVQDGADSAWLPVQTGVAEWMGDTKVYRPGRSLISAGQIEQLPARLQPGDVLLERREWYLSNIGLPGFWPHAALYIGTAEERRAFFADPDVIIWIQQQGEASGDLEELLKARYPEALAQSLAPQEHDRAVRVIEAIGEGVSLTTLEYSAACDSLAVLRPRLSKVDKARALVRAFHYVGRPYDFNFDFATDSRMVCTELIYKAYEPAEGVSGLDLPLTEMLGRKVMPANKLVQQFDERHGKPEQQFDLVLFLDGRERDKNAVEASLEEFRSSWKRPKWHVLVQEF